MNDEIFNVDLLKYARVFKIMTAPLGDYAPRCRLLSIDYKNQSGVDCSQDIAIGQNPNMTDERLVELVQEQYTNKGFNVSAITEVIEEDCGIIPRVLYIKPGFLQEDMIERGLPVPQDMAAALAYAGIYPVNIAELVKEAAHE